MRRFRSTIPLCLKIYHSSSVTAGQVQLYCYYLLTQLVNIGADTAQRKASGLYGMPATLPCPSYDLSRGRKCPGHQAVSVLHSVRWISRNTGHGLLMIKLVEKSPSNSRTISCFELLLTFLVLQFLILTEMMVSFPVKTFICTLKSRSVQPNKIVSIWQWPIKFSAQFQNISSHIDYQKQVQYTPVNKSN